MRTREEIFKSTDLDNASFRQVEIQLDIRDLLIGLQEQIDRMFRLIESIEYSSRTKK